MRVTGQNKNRKNDAKMFDRTIELNCLWFQVQIRFTDIVTFTFNIFSSSVIFKFQNELINNGSRYIGLKFMVSRHMSQDERRINFKPQVNAKAQQCIRRQYQCGSTCTARYNKVINTKEL